MMLQMGKIERVNHGASLPVILSTSNAFGRSETRLRWRFKKHPAQGTSDDELIVSSPRILIAASHVAHDSSMASVCNQADFTS